jgi:hypothetical protein
MMSDNSSTEDIDLQDGGRYKDILKWYDQQIVLATKSKELSELKSAIAKARAEEAFALVQVARMSVYGGEGEKEEGGEVES